MSATTESEPKSAAFPIDLSPLTDPEAIAARDRLWLEKVYALSLIHISEPTRPY